MKISLSVLSSHSVMGEIGVNLNICLHLLSVWVAHTNSIILTNTWKASVLYCFWFIILLLSNNTCFVNDALFVRHVQSVSSTLGKLHSVSIVRCVSNTLCVHRVLHLTYMNSTSVATSNILNSTYVVVFNTMKQYTSKYI